MADNNVPTRICDLRVNLHCCRAYPEKVNMMLQKIKGAHDIYIDTEERLVIVAGLLDPALLRKTIGNVGIVAELLVYEKDPIQAMQKLDYYLKKMQIFRGQNGNPSNSKDKERRVKGHQPASASLLENSDTDSIDHDHGYSDAGYTMPNVAYDHVPQWPNSISCHNPNHSTTKVFLGPIAAFARQNYVCPMFYNRQPPPPCYINRTRPPLPNPFSINQLHEQDFDNAFHHILCDDNVGACSIT